MESTTNLSTDEKCQNRDLETSNESTVKTDSSWTIENVFLV